MSSGCHLTDPTGYVLYLYHTVELHPAPQNCVFKHKQDGSTLMNITIFWFVMLCGIYTGTNIPVKHAASIFTQKMETVDSSKIYAPM